MTPNAWFYQLLLASLMWLCVILHVWWPEPRHPASQRPMEPAKPRRKRSKAPKPLFCPGSCQLMLTSSGAHGHEGPWLSQALATPDSGNGSRLDDS